MIEKLCAVYAPTRASAIYSRSSVNPSTTAARHPCPRDHGTGCRVHDTCGRVRRDTPARTPTRADTDPAGGVPVTWTRCIPGPAPVPVTSASTTPAASWNVIVTCGDEPVTSHAHVTGTPATTGRPVKIEVQPDEAECSNDRAAHAPSASRAGPPALRSVRAVHSTRSASPGVNRFPRCACTETQCHGPEPHAPDVNAARAAASPGNASPHDTSQARGDAGTTCTLRRPSTVTDSRYRPAACTRSADAHLSGTSLPSSPRYSITLPSSRTGAAESGQNR